MKKLILLALFCSQMAFATQAEFCAGFTEGYKTIKGNMVMVPMCPMAPMERMGTTHYRMGILAGINAARRS